MNYKPIIIVLGEPYSIFPEIYFKIFNNYIKKLKTPIILIGSINLIIKQMKFFKYKFDYKKIKISDIQNIKDNKYINIIDVDFKSKNTFAKYNNNSNIYIKNSFDIAFQILKRKKVLGLINGPINKKKFFKKKYLGMTEYFAKYSKSKNTAMLIYNENLSVCPLTTHLPLKKVTKSITLKLIGQKVKLIDFFYKEILKIKPKIAILGLNPHCETTDRFSEEEKIIIPAIKKLKKNKIDISGPFSADTFFLKKNIKKYNIVVGHYHDQVLTPIKTLYEFNAINITLGLPYIRISPDHGPNENMVSKNKSNPLSLRKSIEFFVNLNEN